MYILYLDESGNESSVDDGYFVLAGAAVFERQTYFLSERLQDLQVRFLPGRPPVEFHTTDIRTGKGFWRKVDESCRMNLLRGVSDSIVAAPSSGLALFAAAVEMNDKLYGEEAVRCATEQVCKRFDTYLKRCHQRGDPQRGLLVFAEGRQVQRQKLWVTGFRTMGTQWGVLNNLSDIPYFAKASETRLLQIADFVAHAVYRYYTANDSTLLTPILPKFDQLDGVIHGLVHMGKRSKECSCPACRSRRAPRLLTGECREAVPEGAPRT